MTRKVSIGVLVVLIIVGLTAFALRGKTKNSYVTATIDRGDVRAEVEATGTINAVTTVAVGSQVSGTITKIYADFNSRVRRGQVIAELDQSLLRGAVVQMQADLQNAHANFAATKANLIKARAQASQSTADFRRTKELAAEGVMSQQQLDVARANSEAADANVAATEAQLDQAEAQVQQRRASLDVAKTNLDHTIIAAPVDGVVIARNVDVGQTVAASFQAPTLFTIAQDLTKMQVYAKTDESDVGLVKAKQAVTFKVDAFPNEQFSGHVTQIRMNATTVQNVVTYDTVIEFDNPEQKLFPGMTAYITIPVANAQGVLRVPNGALRFSPAKTRAKEATSTESKSVSAADSTVWKVTADGKLQATRIRVGITDHTKTQVIASLDGDLKPGDRVAIGTTSSSQTTSSSASPPPGPPPQ